MPPTASMLQAAPVTYRRRQATSCQEGLGVLPQGEAPAAVDSPGWRVLPLEVWCELEGCVLGHAGLRSWLEISRSSDTVLDCGGTDRRSLVAPFVVGCVRVARWGGLAATRLH